MKNITPHLWYDKEAQEAANFYISLFDNSSIDTVNVIKDTPSGDAEILTFKLAGQPFMSISAGPYFKFNPSISLMVNCNTKDEVDKLWQAFTDGGSELKPLGEYPFSPYYSWVQDRFGLSWQLMLTETNENIPKIIPNLLFSNGVCGLAEEAANFYVDIFKQSSISFVSYYKEGEATAKNAKVNFISFSLDNFPLTAMDNAFDVDYSFDESFSLILNCDNQEEIDYYWDKLSAIPEAEQCGWVKDKFGFSWQIIPYNMGDLMTSGTEEENQKTTEAMLKMKKIDIEGLKGARFL